MVALLHFKVNKTSQKYFEFLMQLFSWKYWHSWWVKNTHWSTADPNGLLSNNFDNIVMTNNCVPFLSSFIWDVIALDRFSLFKTTSTEKQLLIFSTGNNFALSVRLISFGCLAHLQDSMTSSCTMISRRQVIMVVSSKNKNGITGLSVWSFYKNGSTIPAT